MIDYLKCSTCWKDLNPYDYYINPVNPFYLHCSKACSIKYLQEVINRMVEADFSGNFVNPENTKEGDILEILGEGAYEEKENAVTKKKYRMLNIPVSVNGGRELTFTPSMDCGKRLVKAWGKDTKDWVGKKGQAIIVNYKSFGQTKQAIEINPI